MAHDEDSEKDKSRRGGSEEFRLAFTTAPIRTIEELLFAIARALVERPPLPDKPITRISISANMNGGRGGG